MNRAVGTGIVCTVGLAIGMTATAASATVVGSVGVVGSLTNGSATSRDFAPLTGVNESKDGQYDALFGGVNFVNDGFDKSRLRGVARYDLTDGPWQLVGSNPGLICFHFGFSPVLEPAGLLLFGIALAGGLTVRTIGRPAVASLVLGLAFLAIAPAHCQAASLTSGDSKATLCDAARVLVVVANSSDGECVKRIGGDLVHVELLFAPGMGARPSNYEACNERVRGLVQFRLFVFRSETSRPRERFWRERLAAVNPLGELRQLSQSPMSATTNCERRTRQMSEIHQALASILPEHKASLDANLKVELHRLRMLRQRSLRLRSFQLVSGK